MEKEKKMKSIKKYIYKRKQLNVRENNSSRGNKIAMKFTPFDTEDEWLEEEILGSAERKYPNIGYTVCHCKANVIFGS